MNNVNMNNIRALLLSFLSSVLLSTTVTSTATTRTAPLSQKKYDQKKYALIVVDVQHDFMELPFYDSRSAVFFEKGSLAVGNTGWEYVYEVNSCIAQLRDLGVLITFTRDYHPAGHMSFDTSWIDMQGAVIAWQPGIKMQANYRPNPSGACSGVIFVNTNQYLWPVHCVQGSQGSRIVAQVGDKDLVINKGTDPRYDSYSGIKDDGGAQTGMAGALKKAGVTHVFVIGIATDYCVQATVLDALAAGFKVILIPSLCRGVTPATSKAALEKMGAAGAQVCEVDAIPGIVLAH